MNQQLAEGIRQCPSLPTLPAIAMQVLDLAQRQDADIAEIARLIAKDPALSGKILRTVNSTFYGRSQAVGTISHALVILGLQSVKTLVLGFSLVTNLSHPKPGAFKHVSYWRRSIFAATAARTLAGRINLVQHEEAFLAALLSDIGMLVMDRVIGPSYGEVFAKAQCHQELAAAEQSALGMDHAEAAGVLAAHWKLPPLLATPMANHHHPEQVQDPSLRKLSELVHLAGRCADVFVDPSAAAAIADVRKLCQDRHGLTGGDADGLLDEIGKKTKEVAGLFEINIGSPGDYEAILKKANETLVEITLQSQQQATTFAQQATALKERASSLVHQNHQLHRAATMDALTGLANLARFDAFLAEEFAAALRSGRPLALLMMDVDKFKCVNDAHGHPAGDQVLRYLGHLLGAAARAADLAARYGGEELCLVLPNTARPTAAAIAESIRRAIAARPIALNGAAVAALAVTASIGVAIVEPAIPLRQPAHLLKAADLAVYAAKRAGRNCVRVFSLPKPAVGVPAAAA